MNNTTSVTERLDQLEQRIAALEDEAELTRLMTSYGPAVDTGEADEAAALFADDALYDTDGAPLMHGADGVRAMVSGPNQQALIPDCAHVMGPSVVRIDGDTAVGVGYSRVYLRDGDGFRVWRVSANRWEFERREGAWVITNRVNRNRGSEDSSEVLRGALGGDVTGR